MTATVEELPEEEPTPESYYLACLERYEPGDVFPNVGYVRRFRVIMSHFSDAEA